MFDFKFVYPVLAKLVRFIQGKVRQWLLAERPPSFVHIGRHSYGWSSSSFMGVTSTSGIKIGKFCSIAPEVMFLAHVEHPIKFPSTFPFRTIMGGGKNSNSPNISELNSDSRTRGPIVIGNDVWIGFRAVIRSGVTVGSGAILGAGTVVAKNVPPYAIVVGNPAVVIGYRFSEYSISRLLDSKWWDLPDDSIRRLENWFYSEDIDAFVAAVARERAHIE